MKVTVIIEILRTSTSTYLQYSFHQFFPPFILNYILDILFRFLREMYLINTLMESLKRTLHQQGRRRRKKT